MMLRTQETLDSEIIVDSFAGGGGASTGIELALGRIVNAAINHDPAAIRMHEANHPYTEHYQASVWDVDPETVCRGRPVALAWFSPDCKHFSKAKGAALVDRRIRGLAWIVLRWAAKVRPRVIILENVEEFQTWGPVRKGKPVKKLAGTTFQKFVGQLRALGYTVEWRELVAADYGTPTTRRRLVLIARCDGRAIVWPERTHAPRDSAEVRSGKLLPWRSAAEIIDWSLPCPSIFSTKDEIHERYGISAVRPLADNTMRRIIRGVDKFTIKSGAPFIVDCNHSGGGHVTDSQEPCKTITAKHTGGICRPILAPLTMTNTSNSVGAPVSAPMNTVRTGGGGGQMLVTTSLMCIGQTGGGNRIRSLHEPAPTTVSKQEACLVASSLIQYHTEKTESARAAGLDKPICTVDAANRYGLTCANLVEYYGGGRPLDVQSPMHTVTSHDREAVVAAHVVKYKRDEVGTRPSEPLPTQTAGGVFGCCKAVLCKIGTSERLHHWPQIRDLLNRYCGYALGEDDLLLLSIGGVLYYIADIGLRMLSPRELYNAMGFPPDYIIDHDAAGKPYPKTQQVARCGNAVCPPMAAAVVAANLPEYAMPGKIETMAALADAVAM
jgi:DNA (cytosine-5)-methyltransferase 1